MHESQESGLMNTYKLNMPCELAPQSPFVVPPENPSSRKMVILTFNSKHCLHQALSTVQMESCNIHSPYPRVWVLFQPLCGCTVCG